MCVLDFDFHSTFSRFKHGYSNIIHHSVLPLRSASDLRLAQSEGVTSYWVMELAGYVCVVGSKSLKPELPIELLRLVCDWLAKEPQLCLVSLYQVHLQYAESQRAALWTSPTKPNTQTPVPGLVRWLTKALMVNNYDNIMGMLKRGATTIPTVDFQQQPVFQFAWLASFW